MNGVKLDIAGGIEITGKTSFSNLKVSDKQPSAKGTQATDKLKVRSHFIFGLNVEFCEFQQLVPKKQLLLNYAKHSATLKLSLVSVQMTGETVSRVLTVPPYVL